MSIKILTGLSLAFGCPCATTLRKLRRSAPRGGCETQGKHSFLETVALQSLLEGIAHAALGKGR
jgi:hypothetical protein